MTIERITDRRAIVRFLRNDAGLHLYELGDLDEFFWPATAWYAAREKGAVHAIAMIYAGAELPVLLAMENADPTALRALLAGITADLPSRIYCHLTPGLESELSRWFSLEHYGWHHKMLLRDPDKLLSYDTSDVISLTRDDLGEIQSFYQQSYTGNWFDPRMLDTGQYCGIRVDRTLASVAGVHVYSPAYKVAALGNIATRPDYRGRGLGARVTAGLCRQLLRSVETIGLNVKADNAAAIACYTKLGFAFNAEYGEYMAVRMAR